MDVIESNMESTQSIVHSRGQRCCLVPLLRCAKIMRRPVCVAQDAGTELDCRRTMKSVKAKAASKICNFEQLQILRSRTVAFQEVLQKFYFSESLSLFICVQVSHGDVHVVRITMSFDHF